MTLTLCVLRSGFSPTLFGSSSSAACVRRPQVWNACAFVCTWGWLWQIEVGTCPQLKPECPVSVFYGSQISPRCIPLAHKQIPAVSTFGTETHHPPLSNRPKRSAPALVYPDKSMQEWCRGVVSNNRMTLLWLLWHVNTDKDLHHNKYSCYYIFLRHFPLFPWFMAVALACVNQPQPAISSQSGVSIVVVKFRHQTGM